MRYMILICMIILVVVLSHAAPAKPKLVKGLPINPNFKKVMVKPSPKPVVQKQSHYGRK